MKRVHYYNRRGRGKHTISYLHHLSANLALPILVIALIVFATTGGFFLFRAYVEQGLMLVGALLASSLRLSLAYALSLLCGIPLALLAVRNRRFESILLPIYDVLESMPILAFFPIIILFFVKNDWLEGAAIFVIFFSMIWNIIFNVIGGLKTIPKEIFAVGTVFELSRFTQFRLVILPALFPALVTASILALAEGWNLIIVAEALHTYAPRGSEAEDLFGIGSILVEAATSGNTNLLVAAMSLLVITIAVFNIFVWQPLLGKAARYKFE